MRRFLATSARLDELSRIIFGNLPHSKVRTGNKVLRNKFKGPLFADYYFKMSGTDPSAVLRNIFPGFLTPQEQRRKTQLEILRRRGKGPPKKGMGKRASKRKK